ncbi:MAG: helix-turn-helix domain-containing protein [Actinomycetales bacterium]|nr:helix-turn-helix domain-containing protein [Actinomycetales bacterium]
MPLDDEVDRLPAAVGTRVREARVRRGWTLDQCADASGVSRRMIVNVEAGTTNASLATLLRLATALQVSLASLVAEPAGSGPVTITRPDDREPVWAGESGATAVLVASADTPDMLELWDWRLAPGQVHHSEAHRPGTRELLHVQAGRVLLTVGGTEHVLRAGDAASLAGDVAHSYACDGRGPARFSLAVFEPRARVRP